MNPLSAFFPPKKFFPKIKTYSVHHVEMLLSKSTNHSKSSLDIDSSLHEIFSMKATAVSCETSNESDDKKQ